MITYDELTRRNSGYVSGPLQERIRTTRLLVAGCGIGSSFAEAAVRLGFESLTLIDGDTVSPHNLNRQDYTAADVGTPKVEALARRLRAINPSAAIRPVCANVDEVNATKIVAEADFVFDTIDFLDLAGIVALHDAARELRRPVITALAIGWGAGCVYLPPDSPWSFRRLFGLPEAGTVSGVSYVETFGKVMGKLAEALPPEAVAVVASALTVMEDGRPCPASQVSPGAFAVGALAATLVVRVLAGEPVTVAPEMVIVDLPRLLAAPGLHLG